MSTRTVTPPLIPLNSFPLLDSMTNQCQPQDPIKPLKGSMIDNINADITRRCSSDVLLYLADFLPHDKEVILFGRTSHSNLLALKDYRMKGKLYWTDVFMNSYTSMNDAMTPCRGRPLSLTDFPQFAIGRFDRITLDRIDEIEKLMMNQTIDTNTSNQTLSPTTPSINRMHDIRVHLIEHKIAMNRLKIRWEGRTTPKSLPFIRLLIDGTKIITENGKVNRCHYTKFDDIQERYTYFDREIKNWSQIEMVNLHWVEQSDHILTFLSQLPNSVISLKLPRFVNESLHSVMLPSSLTYLRFGHVWNQLASGWPPLPTSLKILILGHRFDQSMAGFQFPQSISRMNLGDQFNQPLLVWNLPIALKHLKLSNDWNLPIPLLGVLSSSIETFEFGMKFNQPVDGLRFPCTLRSLIFGYEFNHRIDQLQLPTSLTELDLGGEFNHPIEGNIFPPHLVTLKLSNRFNHPINSWKLPSTLTQLRFGYSFDQPISSIEFDFWPISLIELSWHFRLDWIEADEIKFELESIAIYGPTNPNFATLQPELTPESIVVRLSPESLHFIPPSRAELTQPSNQQQLVSSADHQSYSPSSFDAFHSACPYPHSHPSSSFPPPSPPLLGRLPILNKEGSVSLMSYRGTFAYGRAEVKKMIQTQILAEANTNILSNDVIHQINYRRQQAYDEKENARLVDQEIESNGESDLYSSDD